MACLLQRIRVVWLKTWPADVPPPLTETPLKLRMLGLIQKQHIVKMQSHYSPL